jgi:hypothetical protein
MMDNTTTKTSQSSVCKCCNGTGIQKRNDGIKTVCPGCNGSGNWDMPRSNVTTY